ncbi:hypothetical protein HPP92_023465 [Vanilla planifolia]|uniref:BHLH domain-containing protein n=1 Tax=Vanilla planifolia TaxID=51239 RepID=A0A835UBP3_VANPL|nr:hypothetical protein HPP92_023465 [Vanilla planifolia]
MARPCSSANVAEEFSVTYWNALISAEHNVKYSEPVKNSSLDANVPPSRQGMLEQVVRPAFNNLSFGEMALSFDFCAGNQIHDALSTPNSNLINKNCIEGTIKEKTRKRETENTGLPQKSPSIKNSDSKERIIVSSERVKCLSDRNEKKRRVEMNPDLCASKLASKQDMEASQDGTSSKGEYIHVRAKRGQATNSHSLAERVRREKISERMRVLQDLVPGCNKITGKAVMLDEIINYVQSLQRQVEFLSLKLAAINLDLNFDVDRILSNDRNSSTIGFGSTWRTQYPYLQGAEQIRFETPHAWDKELQNALHMSGIPANLINNSELNGKDRRS